jgi:hypothetical protein
VATDRERQLLQDRNQILERLATLDQERAELAARLTLLELELGL